MKATLAFALVLFACCAACSRSKSDGQAFVDSVLAAVSANQISFALPRMQEQEGAAAAQKKEKEMIALMEKSIAGSKSVTDALLDRLHPELKEYYRDYLIAGQVMYLEGLRTGDSSKQTTAVRAMMTWGEFWGRNKNSIISKLG